ncbi:enoyl-CoA hydratase/isomerase family protein [Nitrospirillum iridis]|uniref:2-(1,2-epoxy-1,2-dihydrophenyl)acetyl-CoA isomerase n=1 Tax=Nitrospirillum iridis TaxID=765888 RepID=A0A7X0EDX7_9PROT|nr:enoyl-CoA hydratase/isomerase family protein [Nitrospirillum iridis]MBB6253287.1 2-(1,2-epoxy-1,2-dihydrophenyl)acetyl-CoA isomerase [Nitrospirillum iridis]
MTQPLLFEQKGPVAHLTLNRPDVGNAIDVPLARALMETAIRCDEDDTIRCVTLRGAGRCFCVGGDIAGFSQAGNALPGLLKELTAYVHMAVSRFARMPKPLLTIVNGAAAGAGMSLSLLGDIVLMAASARLTPAYGGVGLSPDGGLSWVLPRLVGLRRAQEIMLGNRAIEAREAEAIGLVTRAVADADLADESAAMVARLAAAATGAAGRTRVLLRDSFDTSLERHLEAESRAMADTAKSAEAQEGVAAFLAKRKPVFHALEGEL